MNRSDDQVRESSGHHALHEERIATILERRPQELNRMRSEEPWHGLLGEGESRAVERAHRLVLLRQPAVGPGRQYVPRSPGYGSKLQDRHPEQTDRRGERDAARCD